MRLRERKRPRDSWSLLTSLALSFMSLAACDEIPQQPQKATQIAPSVMRFQSNAQLRSTLKTIQTKCKSRYDNNKEGAAVASSLLGGGLIGSIAFDAAKSGYRNCMKQYDQVASLGHAQGFQADPRAEAAAAAQKRREQQQQAWAKAIANASRTPTTTSASNNNYCDWYCQNGTTRQEALAESMHRAGWAGHD